MENSGGEWRESEERYVIVFFPEATDEPKWYDIDLTLSFPKIFNPPIESQEEASEIFWSISRAIKNGIDKRKEILPK